MATAPLQGTRQLELVVLGQGGVRRTSGGRRQVAKWSHGAGCHLEGGREGVLPVEGDGGGHDQQEKGQEHLDRGQEDQGAGGNNLGRRKTEARQQRLRENMRGRYEIPG